MVEGLPKPFCIDSKGGEYEKKSYILDGEFQNIKNIRGE